MGKMGGKGSKGGWWEGATYRIEVSSGSVSSGIPSPTDTPRGRLLAATAELKNPIMASGWQGLGGKD